MKRHSILWIAVCMLVAIGYSSWVAQSPVFDTPTVETVVSDKREKNGARFPMVVAKRRSR